jgi:hypothetical protein
VGGCDKQLEKSGFQGFRVWREIEKELLFVSSGNNMKIWLSGLGFRVWREIEKELLLVCGGHNLKSLSLGFRVWSEIREKNG